jgi:hypothetical protein
MKHLLLLRLLHHLMLSFDVKRSQQPSRVAPRLQLPKMRLRRRVHVCEVAMRKVHVQISRGSRAHPMRRPRDVHRSRSRRSILRRVVIARVHMRGSKISSSVVCPEPALGADAATLLARSLGSPAERADVWKRYLGTNPPAPHLDRARLARAEALLDAGQIVDARVLLEDTKKSPSLNEAQKKELERLLFKAREMH